MPIGTIFDVKEMTVHDGPGVRTTVFLKGCPLRCVWCHNPEGLEQAPQLMVNEVRCRHCGLCQKGCTHEECRTFSRCLHICPDGLVTVAGRRVEAVTLAKDLLRQSDLFSMTGGGVTLSGGEPLMQPEFTLALLEELRPVHRAVETCGFAENDVFQKVALEADLILFDVKIADPKKHKAYTGLDNAPILKNLKTMISLRKPFVARTPLIPGITDTKENLAAVADLLQEAGDSVRIELMPYNPFAGAKYGAIGLKFSPEYDEKQPIRHDLSPFIRAGLKATVL